MKVLITGGAGFVGSSLAKYLKTPQRAIQITVLDNLRRRGSELNLKTLRELGARFVHGDIRSPGDLAELHDEFDLMVEASAEPSVHAGTAGSPDYVVQANLMGTFNCLNFARKQADKFIFLSTSRVYSIAPLREIQLDETPTRFEIAAEQRLTGVTGEGISEEFATNLPRSFYGATKLASEYLMQEFVASYGMKAVAYRCGVLAGPGQFGKADQGVFTLWIANHYFKIPLTYTGFGGQGKQVRDLLHPDDLAELITTHLPTLEKHSGRVFNVGGGADRAISLAELTSLCREFTGNTVPVSSVRETAAVDVPLYVSDCRRIASEVGWKPGRSIRTIISETADWIRLNESELKQIFSQ